MNSEKSVNGSIRLKVSLGRISPRIGLINQFCKLKYIIFCRLV